MAGTPLAKKYFPLKLFCAYIALTVLVAVYGPVKYVGFKPFAVSIYLAAFLLLFAMGYFAGAIALSTT